MLKQWTLDVTAASIAAFFLQGAMGLKAKELHVPEAQQWMFGFAAIGLIAAAILVILRTARAR